MGRQTYRPSSKQQKSTEITHAQEYFSLGMIADAPASEIPDNAVADLYNVVAFERWLQGRYGCRIYRDTCRVTYPEELSWATAFPGDRDRYNLNGSKSGTVITSSDANFTDDDVGNYYVWPDGYNDLIMEVLSSTQVRVRDNIVKVDTTEGYIRGKHNGWWYHKGLKRVVVQVGAEFYVSNSLNLSTWTRVLQISSSLPNNVISQFDDFDDTSIIAFNSGGMMKIVIDSSRPYAYRVNINGPLQAVNEIEQTEELPFGYRYIYTATRLRGTGIRSRIDSIIEQESTPNQPDANKRDYGEVWSYYQRGDSTKEYGVITGGAIAAASHDAVNVWAPINDGTITLTINGRENNIFVDFTGVQTMVDVAAKIQLSMRQYWKDATCEFYRGRLYITSGLVNNSSVGEPAAGVGGTDIYAAGYMNFAGATVENNVAFERPLIIENLKSPRQIGTDDPEWHFTHYSIYRTLDIGEHGTDPVTGQGNDVERYIWCYDLRIAAAFLLSKNASGLATAVVGEFAPEDEGSVIEWEDGDRDLIFQWISSTQVLLTDIGGEPYFDEPKYGAAAIGDGRVFRASQVGNVVTISQGDTVTSADERKTIYWADGSYSYIIDYLNANQVRVHDSETRSSQGMTLDPIGRNYYDRTPDSVLFDRTKSYTLKNRAWERLPLTNTGKVVPGWIFCAVREQQKVYYQQYDPGFKYLVGGHNPIQEITDCKDAIKRIEEFSNRIIVYCSNSVYGGPTNTSIEIKVEGTGEFINVFAGLQLLVEELGVPDYGSVKPINLSQQVCRTSDYGLRIFNGFKFGPNLAETENGLEMVMDELRSWQNATAAGYIDGELFLWGLRK